ncbi:MAG: SIMPL domain-containing protein [Balneolaceae bacterium]|nr:SIMPL domain-containing protein [Balneolaceae bacterium]MBO6547105.1 SIMPL domain-containing protein [Balneolaceae bacterium]MBO6647948.1 SIMPL domain-containing protein [Balneolaceae bacterium]
MESNMKQLFIITLLVFGMGCATQARQLTTGQEKISISMTATEAVEADLIIFNININAEAKSPQAVFGLHQQREELLASLLKEFDIEDENINFQPVRMNKRYTNDRNSQITVTNQQVSVTFNDFDIYERIQLTLIENNFDSFSGNFSSTKIAEGKDKALVAAIQSAKEKATLITEASGVELGGIINISYSDYTVTPSRSFGRNEMMAMDASSSMMDFDQVINVTANISIEFSIE